MPPLAGEQPVVAGSELTPMCGRLDQNDINRLIQNFAWAGEVFNCSQAEGKYNVSPGSYRPVLHVVDDNLFIEDLHWGYRSSWAEAEGKIPVVFNTRLEKITNRYWKPLLKKGRAIVPAAGWYEWTGEKGHKQPWHVHRRDGKPLYLAALANFASGSATKTASGFTLITADAEGGMLDAHDRRPCVLTSADAEFWLDPGVDAQQAEHFVRSVALGFDAFAWHRVTKAVGNINNQGAELAAPLVS
jgi:putative SOS response-associated peptidase YedK